MYIEGQKWQWLGWLQPLLQKTPASFRSRLLSPAVSVILNYYPQFLPTGDVEAVTLAICILILLVRITHFLKVSYSLQMGRMGLRKRIYPWLLIYKIKL